MTSPTPEQSAAVDVGRRLAIAGIPIFLAEPDCKRGRWQASGGHGGCGYWIPERWHQATPDPAVLDQWRPGVAIAAVMGHGLDLIDVDPRNGGDINDVLDLLPAVRAAASTPSGGWHAFVDSLGVRSRDNVLRGIDVKAGTNGQGHGFAFIAPTVRLPKGGGDPTPYVWERSPDVATFGRDGGDPSALIELIAAARRGPTNGEPFTTTGPLGPSPWDDLTAVLADNGRHHAVVKLASSLRGRGGWRLDDALAYMREVVHPKLDQTRGGHPYTLDELEADVRDVFTRYPDGHDEPSAPGVTTPLVVDPSELEVRYPRVDWHDLFDGEPPDVDWIIEGILEEGRAYSLFGPAKSGKSLVALEIVAAIAAGRSEVLGQRLHGGPRTVLVIDKENDRRDLRWRLEALGYGPDDLDQLFYLSFPSLPPLDRDAGGTDVVALARHYGAELVVLDTLSRMVAGPENDSDTFLAFYRASVMPLKAAGIATLRLDHSGKDQTRGQRGSSAKAADVDAVWRITAHGNDRVRLSLEEHRQPYYLDHLWLTRQTDPLRHVPTEPTALDDPTLEAVARLDELDVDPDWGRRKAASALRDAGHTVRNEAVMEAQRIRRNRSRTGAPQGPPGDRSGDRSSPKPESAVEAVPDRSGTAGTGGLQSPSERAVPGPHHPGGGDRAAQTGPTPAEPAMRPPRFTQTTAHVGARAASQDETTPPECRL